MRRFRTRQKSVPFRLAHCAAIGVIVAAILGLSGWSAAALAIDLAGPWRVPAVALYLATVIAGLVFLRSWILRFLACLSCFAVVLAWWLSLSPATGRDWQQDVAQTAWAELNGDSVTIHNLRNFEYRTETDYVPRWETRSYDLSKMTGVDFFITYWGSPWIAHPILSFGFADGRHVAFSVETRKVVGQEYSAFLGFFRQYELIYIVADERDVIRLRTNYRKGEEVYLYHSTTSADEARAMFLDYLRAVNALHEAPAFYNAITSNCTTNIRVHTAAARDGKVAKWDWRLLLNGKSDEFAYQYGRLAGNLPFDELKRRAHINDAARAANDAADFSEKIRLGRPGFGN